MAIIQGTNAPIELVFDQDLSQVTALAVSAWSLAGRLVKEWSLDEVVIEGQTVYCPLTEAESAKLPSAGMVMEAKGLNEAGETVFWSRIKVKVSRRFDRVIYLMEESQ